MIVRDGPASGLFEEFVDSTEGKAAGPIPRNVERLRGLVSAAEQDFEF